MPKPSLMSSSLVRAAAVALLLGVPATAVLAADPAAQRAEVRKMCDEALATLYKSKPELQARIAKAAGYGCFSSYGVSFIVGGAGGRGLVHPTGGKEVYMSMGQASAGLDIGIKDYREVLVFKDAATLNKFIESGWEFGGQAGATATAKGKGGTTEMGEMATGPIEVYPMTKTGLAAGVSAAGRKYWKDKELNP
ncbi:YSC84-related protein [Rivibacter subsaxonicus]|uniref:Las17-binding protein actin regulator n=1 Tax=Rivibacter subsaxonicus TaxID=457575 RepID=A0A4Q7W190_9BURK|nr:lipid-binding SYLF domain-containing protein [Rivibacter subsaxonicus]RZU02668.1 Las17-binding protein actin regulator [Rivibacter subsaxonicus]